MLEIKKGIKRFQEFGGWRLIVAYFRMGILWSGIKSVLKCVLEHHSLKAAYSEIIKNVEGILIKQYGRILNDKLKDTPIHECDRRTVPKIIWTCWLQGMEQAPEMVKNCIESQKRCFPDYVHHILTMTNYNNWVTLPDYIEEKFKKGQIPRALFSDLLRLSVLKQYGGVWLDASVLCTGFGNETLQNRWRKIEECEFTIFRYFEKGTRRVVGLSNWFIAARPNEIVVSAVLDMLLAYWKNYNCTVDYYIMHLFISYALQNNLAITESMPRENSFHSIMLGNVLDKDFNNEWWEEVKAHVFIHKLNYRKANVAKANPRSFYNEIFSRRLKY